MRLFNTLSRQKEEFKPIDEKQVRYYSCGPTVYDLVHIGNLRAYLFNDFLKRTLVLDGYKLNDAMNITDVDDKTIRNSGGDLAKFKELTKEYEDKFWLDLKSLNIRPPKTVTRATEYVDKIVEFIKDLIGKGYAYKASDGSTYFSIAKFSDYGKLANLDQENLKSGARVGMDEYDKENPADFALWKAWDESDGEVFWETELGKGRPGWSIECSVMSTDALGDTIDIHTGGVDLIFPHHENEIAQSEAKTGQKFVNFWLHNDHLLVDGQKMSKSLRNFYTLSDIEEKGFSALDFRYFVFGAHYRSKLNFTWAGMAAARNARERMKRFYQDNISETGEVCQVYLKKFMSKLEDDLATPEAMAVVWELVKDENKSLGKKIATLKKIDDEVLCFGLSDKDEIPAEIIDLADERKSARANKDFAKSDELRETMKSKGWLVEDIADNDYKITKI